MVGVLSLKWRGSEIVSLTPVFASTAQEEEVFIYILLQLYFDLMLSQSALRHGGHTGCVMCLRFDIFLYLYNKWVYGWYSLFPLSIQWCFYLLWWVHILRKTVSSTFSVFLRLNNFLYFLYSIFVLNLKTNIDVVLHKSDICSISDYYYYFFFLLSFLSQMLLFVLSRTNDSSLNMTLPPFTVRVWMALFLEGSGITRDFLQYVIRKCHLYLATFLEPIWQTVENTGVRLTKEKEVRASTSPLLVSWIPTITWNLWVNLCNENKILRAEEEISINLEKKNIYLIKFHEDIYLCFQVSLWSWRVLSSQWWRATTWHCVAEPGKIISTS